MTWALPRLSVAGWVMAMLISAAAVLLVCWSGQARTIEGMAVASIAVFSGPLTVIDARYHLLPNILILPLGALAGTLMVWAAFQRDSLHPLAGAGTCAGLMALATWLAVISDSQAVGLGDLKLLIALGIGVGMAGPARFVMTICVGVVAAGLWATSVVVCRRASRSASIALGPWLLLGAVGGSALWPQVALTA